MVIGEIVASFHRLSVLKQDVDIHIHANPILYHLNTCLFYQVTIFGGKTKLKKISFLLVEAGFLHIKLCVFLINCINNQTIWDL